MTRRQSSRSPAGGRRRGPPMPAYGHRSATRRTCHRLHDARVVLGVPVCGDALAVPARRRSPSPRDSRSEVDFETTTLHPSASAFAIASPSRSHAITVATGRESLMSTSERGWRRAEEPPRGRHGRVRSRAGAHGGGRPGAYDGAARAVEQAFGASSPPCRAAARPTCTRPASRRGDGRASAADERPWSARRRPRDAAPTRTPSTKRLGRCARLVARASWKDVGSARRRRRR